MSADERAEPPRVGRPDVLEVEIDGHLVLYDPVAERIHVLDPRTRRIWGAVRGGADTEGSVGDPIDAGGLAALEELGLVVAPTRAAASPPEMRIGATPRATQGTFCSPALELLDQRVVVSSEDPAVVAAVSWYAAPLAVAGRPSRFVALGPAADGERRVPAWLNRVASDTGGCTVLHAAGVVAGSSALLLPGGPGAGKSTFVAALVAAGLGYLGDEAVGTGPEGEVLAFPKRIALERGSWELVGDPAAHRRATRAGFDPTRVHWLDPRDLHADSLRWRDDVTARPRVRLVVAPTFAPGAPPELRRLDPLDAFTALVGNASNLPRVGASGLETFRRLALEVPCFALRHGGVHDALAATHHLLAEHGLAVS